MKISGNGKFSVIKFGNFLLFWNVFIVTNQQISSPGTNWILNIFLKRNLGNFSIKNKLF